MSMLAVACTDALCLINSSAIKYSQVPSSLPSCITLTEPAVASAWSSDNAVLFIASAHAVHQYDPSTNSLKELLRLSDGDGAISNFVCKDRTTLIYAVAHKIHTWTPEESTGTSLIESHKSPITSLSLSSDFTLLASTSADGVHVHNLSLGSHTVLKGLPASSTVSASAFHPYTRTRLFLGLGKQLVIYDTTRPSSPLKIVPLGDSPGIAGNIVAVAGSPFSKTLVVATTTGGNIVVIDLEKEKGPHRLNSVKVPLTSLAFSHEGGLLYLGTGDGKLLVLDLRVMDRGPKSTVVSDIGSRIQALSFQKKVKTTTELSKATSGSTSTKLETTNHTRRPLTQASSKVAAGTMTARARITRTGSNAVTPIRRLPSTVKKSGTTTKTTGTAAAEPPQNKILSPVRDPLGNSTSAGDISVQIETLSAIGGATPTTQVAPVKRATSISAVSAVTASTRSRPSPLSKVSARSSGLASPSISAVTKRYGKTPIKDKEPAGHVSASSRMRTTSGAAGSTTSAAAVKATIWSSTKLSVPKPQTDEDKKVSIRARPRTASSASRANTAAERTPPGLRLSSRTGASSASASSPSSSRNTTKSRSKSSSPILPILRGRSRGQTPSPELPDLNIVPVTPVAAIKADAKSQRQTALGMLGLGTPEVDRWIQAGKNKGKGRVVGFQDDEGDDSEDDSEDDDDDGEREPSLAMQISPHRSPLRHSIPISPSGGMGSPSSAHQLLRTIVQDVMYDFQRDTKAEMVGLHLDLVRMGRGWKRELREAMDEYVGSLKELREENVRLRKENDMLRRGF